MEYGRWNIENRVDGKEDRNGVDDSECLSWVGSREDVPLTCEERMVVIGGIDS